MILSALTTDFNPRPPWGGRHLEVEILCLVDCISIHALRGEGDIDAVLVSVHFIVISIHALRGEGDVNVLNALKDRTISIHALRGEGDKHTK